MYAIFFQGTVVAVIGARDGDLGESRPVLLTLEGDDLGFFELVDEEMDPATGMVTARLVTSEIPLDREHPQILLNGGIYTFSIKVRVKSAKSSFHLTKNMYYQPI